MDTDKQVILTEETIKILEKAGDNAFRIMVEQARINPNAIEALYG